MSKVTSLWWVVRRLRSLARLAARQPERASDFSGNELDLQKSAGMQWSANKWLRSRLLMT